MRLDPGLAFGSGSHPTTRLCLHWIAGLDLRGRTLADYGCGSGILAIAAVKLGAARAFAVDLDPQARRAAADNAARNGVAERVRTLSPADVAGMQADALVANILAAPLIELAPSLAALLPEGAAIALSGLLADQAGALEDAYAPWFELAERRHDAEWILLAGTRLRENV